MLQIQEVHLEPHSNARNFCCFYLYFHTCPISELFCAHYLQALEKVPCANSGAPKFASLDSHDSTTIQYLSLVFLRYVASKIRKIQCNCLVFLEEFVKYYGFTASWG